MPLDPLDTHAVISRDELEQALVPVPVDVFRDIQEFFDVFEDRCHHAKEESEPVGFQPHPGRGAHCHARLHRMIMGLPQRIDPYVSASSGNKPAGGRLPQSYGVRSRSL
jgi:hypothetical protein